MSRVIRISSKRYASYDDCLAEAAREVAQLLDLAGWNLAARWEADDDRSTILLSVPDHIAEEIDSSEARTWERIWLDAEVVSTP